MVIILLYDDGLRNWYRVSGDEYIFSICWFHIKGLYHKQTRDGYFGWFWLGELPFQRQRRAFSENKWSWCMSECGSEWLITQACRNGVKELASTGFQETLETRSVYFLGSISKINLNRSGKSFLIPLIIRISPRNWEFPSFCLRSPFQDIHSSVVSRDLKHARLMGSSWHGFQWLGSDPI